jgi:hypothetical protein
MPRPLPGRPERARIAALLLPPEPKEPHVRRRSARLSPTLDWLIEVIPQWSGAELAKVLTAPVDVVLTGITAKRFQLVPNGTERVGVEVGASGAGASISGDGLEAVSWLTGRSDKVLATSVDGDTALAVAVLAAMRAV